MYSKFSLKYFLLLSFLLFSIICTISSIIEDKYSVFKVTFHPQLTTLGARYEPNQNYCKMEYILHNLNKYDTYIFGSSRVGKLPNEEITNVKVYNFSYSEGIPKEHLDNVKYLIKKKAHIKTIIIGLDDFSYKVDPKEHFTQLLRIPHPDATDKNKLLFLIRYIRYGPYDFEKYNTKNDPNFDLFSSGRVQPPESLNKQIENNKEEYVKDKKFLEPCEYPFPYREETIEALSKLKSLCDKNNIKLIFIVNPIHKITYLYANNNDFNRFKRELVKISPFWDFAYFNSITTNNYYYYETSHYRELVGRMILERLGYLKTKTAHKDFGQYITQDNIESHIKFLETNYKKHKYENIKN